MSTLSDIHVHPLRWFGLRNLPGIPLEFDELLDTALKLAKRDLDMKPAKAGLTNEYTIGGSSATAREFLYGETLENRLATALEHLCDFLERKPRQVKGALLGTLAGKGDFLESIEESSELTKKSLDTADQWSISLTNYENTYQQAKPHFPDWESTLTDSDAATKRFWPTIVEYGLAYNLLMVRKVNRRDVEAIKSQFGESWQDTWVESGNMYVIDLSIFSQFESESVDGYTRFTPGTVTLLRQDDASKNVFV